MLFQKFSNTCHFWSYNFIISKTSQKSWSLSWRSTWSWWSNLSILFLSIIIIITHCTMNHCLLIISINVIPRRCFLNSSTHLLLFTQILINLLKWILDIKEIYMIFPVLLNMMLRVWINNFLFRDKLLTYFIHCSNSSNLTTRKSRLIPILWIKVKFSCNILWHSINTTIRSNHNIIIRFSNCSHNTNKG